MFGWMSGWVCKGEGRVKEEGWKDGGEQEDGVLDKVGMDEDAGMEEDEGRDRGGIRAQVEDGEVRKW